MEKRFEALHSTLVKQLESHHTPGLALVVTEAGVPVYELYHGYRDVAHRCR